MLRKILSYYLKKYDFEASVNSRVVCIFILSTEYSKCLDQQSRTSKSLGFL